MQSHLKKFVGLFVILTFSVSCGSGVPKKPSIDLCGYDLQTDLAYCNNNQTSREFELERNELDNYIMMSPEHWGLTLTYIRLLEGRLRSKSTKRELRKFRKSGMKAKNGYTSHLEAR